jgi:ammonium transporter Rh
LFGRTLVLSRCQKFLMSESSKQGEKKSSKSSVSSEGENEENKQNKQGESRSEQKEDRDVELGELKKNDKQLVTGDKNKEKNEEKKNEEQSDTSDDKSEKKDESAARTSTTSSDTGPEKENSKAEPFAIFAFVLQVAFIVLFWTLTDYDLPNVGNQGTQNNVERYYVFYIDVAVMMFIGFGYLMTFLRKYRYGALVYTFFVTVFVIQWSILVLGFFNKALVGGSQWTSPILIDLTLLINALFASAAVLISLGGIIGKVSPFQMLFLTFMEVILYGVNIFIGVGQFNAIDIGGSIFIHTFGAYFGLAASFFVSPRRCEKSPNNSSTYNSNTFSLIGTIFLWILWPSFNSALATDLSQARTIINTVLSLSASGFIVCGLSKIIRPNRKWEMEDIENATLAGGVAIGAVANLKIGPGGALLIGTIAGTVSVLGFRFIGPGLRQKIGLRDTCGIHNLHGMPGLIGAVSSIIASAVATTSLYGAEYTELFPMSSLQWRAQIIATVITLGIACGGGVLIGFILRLFFRVTPRPKSFYDDAVNFAIQWKEE